MHNFININGKNDMEINESTLPIVEKIAECMPGGFFIYYANEEQKLIFYNNSMLRIFGCDTGEEFEELTGNSFRGIVHPEDWDEVDKSIREQIRDSKYNLDYVEYRIIRKDGTVRWVEDYGHFAHTSMYGDVFYVFIEDATERLEKRLAELERKNEELNDAYNRESQYKKAILHNSIAFYEVNLSKDMFITSASQVIDGQVVDVFEFLGIPKMTKYSEYINMWANHVSEDERANYRQFFNNNRLICSYNNGKPEQVYEAWVVDTYGKRRLEHYAILLGKQEYTEDIIALFVCTDVTEHNELQDLLRVALRQTQSANIAKSTFLANMSHDIRTPLNAIVGYTDLLKNCSDNPKILDYVEKIKSSSNALLSIVKESMEVTWVESGKAVLKETGCNIIDFLNDIVSEVNELMEKKKLTFYVDFESIWHKNIYADIIRLKEIISQLLDNAIKYTNSEGFVRFTVKETSSTFENYGQFYFIVQDNGIGFEEGFKQHLFDAFAREKNTTMSKVLGTGLGLTVVKAFVDLMGGSIDVDSKIGKGSTFTVKLLFRLGEDENSGLHIKQLERSLLKGRKILLVEDNEINAEIGRELLEQFGLIIDLAENGLDALEKIKSQPSGYYCAVLMDIQMPVMDGYEATRQIRKLEETGLAKLPIIALSANAFPEDQQKSIECGMDAHFAKPIKIDSLVDLMCRVLSENLEESSEV